jgi:hypothetical protein
VSNVFTSSDRQPIVNYFLVVFDRKKQELVSIETFADSSDAVKARFKMEMEDPRSGLEIVVLGAENQEVLTQSHARYFGFGQRFASVCFGSNEETKLLNS